MFISIDVGGTNTRVAGSTDVNKPVFVNEPLRRKNTHNFEDDLTFMVEAARKIADGQPIKALGICVPGFLNQEKTQLTFAANLMGWVDKPLVKSLSDKLNCPVFCRTDVTAAILGEVYYSHENSDFDFIMWGTGIGGATVHLQNDQPEIKPIDWYKNFEAWEGDCGGAALAKTYDKSPEEFTDQEWDAVIQKFQNYLRRHVETNKPKAITFGGGLAQRHVRTLKEFSSSLGIQIAVTKFGGDSGLMGGFGLIKQNFSA